MFGRSWLTSSAAVGGAAVCLALGGCGSTSPAPADHAGTATTHSAGVSKATYIAKADAICTAEHHLYETFPFPKVSVTETNGVVHDNIAVVGHALAHLTRAVEAKSSVIRRLPEPAGTHQQLAVIWHQSAMARRITNRLVALTLSFPPRITSANLARVKQYESRASAIQAQAVRLQAQEHTTTKAFGFKVCGTQPPMRNLGGGTPNLSDAI
jgi:hypothetical protein